MKKQYLLLKTCRLLISIFMVLILGVLLIFIFKRMTSEANVYSSFPAILNFLYLILYLPISAAGIWGLVHIKRKLKELFPEKYPPRGPLTRQLLIKIILKTIIIVTISVTALSLAAPFAIIYIATNHHVYYRNDALLQMTYTASDFSLEENILTLKTEDKLDLWASEISVNNPKAVVIQLTGIEQPSITQFYPQAKMLKKNGYASILLEVRGHGRSSGNKVCLGYDEILDVKAALDFIKSKDEYKNIPVVLQGVSMGGAIAVNAFGQYKEIDALIAMSAYTTFEDVVIDNLKYYKVPDFICTIAKPVFKLALEANFGSNKVEHMNPITQIQNSGNRPVFLIASREDASVPVTNTQHLYEISAGADLWIRESWEHFIIKDCVLTKVEEDQEYCDKILDFLEKVSGK
jgi:esterase/lipase